MVQLKACRLLNQNKKPLHKLNLNKLVCTSSQKTHLPKFRFSWMKVMMFSFSMIFLMIIVLICICICIWISFNTLNFFIVLFNRLLWWSFFNRFSIHILCYRRRIKNGTILCILSIIMCNWYLDKRNEEKTCQSFGHFKHLIIFIMVLILKSGININPSWRN